MLKAKISGIYKIINLVNNKFYIGSAVDIRERYYIHFGQLRKNKHNNKHLQSSFNKHSENNFKVEVVTTCPKEYLLKLEQFFIDTLKPNYNICKIAGSLLGFKKSEISKQKLKDTCKRKLETIGTRKLTLFQIEEIKNLLNKGILQKDIANLYNVGIPVISKLKRKYKIERNTTFEERKLQVKNEKYPKEYLEQITEQFKKSNCSKYKFIKENNLTSSFYRLLK